MTRYFSALVLTLCACAPAPLPPSDAAPDSMPADAPDDRVEPADVPELDAALDAPTADVPSSPDVLEPRDVVDAARPDAPSDAGATPPDINARFDAMELRVLMRRTCAVGFTDGCDEVQSQAFEATCSVRGSVPRFSIYFLPCGRGPTRCGEVFANVEGTFTSIAASSSIGAAPTQGTDAIVTPGFEWTDGMGQRRQNFYVRARLSPSATGIRGIAGIAGRTQLAEYADFYALACPKGP